MQNVTACKHFGLMSPSVQFFQSQLQYGTNVYHFSKKTFSSLQQQTQIKPSKRKV